MASMMKKLLLLFTILFMMVNCHTVKGEEFKVVWDFKTISPNYEDEWSAARNFHVGDTLDFLYIPGWTEMYQVTAANYENCNYLEPLATLSDSSTGAMRSSVSIREAKFKIKEHGDFYFLSKFAYELPCEDTFKLHIHIPEASPSLDTQSSTASYDSSQSSYVSSQSDAPAPAPTSSHSRSKIPHSYIILGAVLASIVVLAIVALVVYFLCR